MNFDADSDNETLPPGVVSREASERMLEVTGTKPTETGLSKQADIRKHAFIEINELTEGTPRKKWTHTEVRRMATQEQWEYGERYGHLDVGTTCAVGTLLLRGLSPSATRKALGITLGTWNAWYTKGTAEDEAGDSTLTQAPYNVFAFVVDHSQAVMEMRAVNGWAGHFDRDWRAAQAYLVARNPDEWNPVSKSTIDTTSTIDHHVMASQDTTGLLEVAAILARANALPKPVASVEVVEVESIEVYDPGTGDL